MRLAERDGIGKVCGAATAEKAGDLDLAGLPPQLVPLLEFANHLELLEGRIEIETKGTVPVGRRYRQVEDAAANGPAALIPFRCRAIGVAPAVSRVVERSGIDQRPVQKIGLGIVRIPIGVEHIDHGEASDP